jgi:hypothetical protein
VVVVVLLVVVFFVVLEDVVAVVLERLVSADDKSFSSVNTAASAFILPVTDVLMILPGKLSDVSARAELRKIAAFFFDSIRIPPQIKNIPLLYNKFI